jgi:hypothetical protein
MGIITTNKTVPIKLKISSLFVKNEKERIPSSKYQIPRERINAIINSMIGKIRQQSLFFIY